MEKQLQKKSKENTIITASEEVYKILREAITSGRFRPGEHLVERALCEELGISRTPVREAFKRLEKERFVTIKPYSGVTVTKVTLDEAEDVYQFRKAVEGMAAELVAEKRSEATLGKLEDILRRINIAHQTGEEGVLAALNNDFHQLLADECGNALIKDAIFNIMGYISIIRLSVWNLPMRTHQTTQDHIDIMEAIRNRDAKKAREAMEKHIIDSWEAAKAGFNYSKQRLPSLKIGKGNK